MLYRAWLEFRVTRQISTGNGESYLAQEKRPTPQFVMGELGYGANERPCGDCHKACTLDYTLNNLDSINRTNLRDLDQRDPLSVPDRITSVDGDLRQRFGLKGAPVVDAYGNAIPEPSRKSSGKKMSAKEAQKALRAQLRRTGIRVVKGAFVDERPRTLVPMNPNGLGRRSDRADKLIAAHRARQSAA